MTPAKPTEKTGLPRLVIATDSYLPRWDGIAKFLSDIIPLLTRYFQVTVIAPKFVGTHATHPGVTEILMPLRNFKVGDYQFPTFVTKSARRAVEQADLVWTHTVGPIGSGVIKLAKKKKKTVIGYIHSIEWELFGRSIGNPLFYVPIATMTRKIIKKTYAKCDALMFPSHVAMNLFSWYKFKSKMLLAPLGIDLKKYSPPASRTDAKKAIGLNAEDLVIGYCGRIAHEKDIRTLVRAFLRIRDYYDNLKLVLVGPGLDDMMTKFGRMRNIMLTGEQSDVVPYYQAMDIYVLPSLTETTSLSTLEAMSCEAAVCATPVGEVANYIKNRKNGFLFSKGNSYELSQMLRMLLDDQKLRTRMAKKGRETVELDYDWRDAAKRIITILRKAVK